MNDIIRDISQNTFKNSRSYDRSMLNPMNRRQSAASDPFNRVRAPGEMTTREKDAGGELLEDVDISLDVRFDSGTSRKWS